MKTLFKDWSRIVEKVIIERFYIEYFFVLINNSFILDLKILPKEKISALDLGDFFSIYYYFYWFEVTFYSGFLPCRFTVTGGYYFTG